MFALSKNDLKEIGFIPVERDDLPKNDGDLLGFLTNVTTDRYISICGQAKVTLITDRPKLLTEDLTDAKIIGDNTYIIAYYNIFDNATIFVPYGAFFAVQVLDNGTKIQFYEEEDAIKSQDVFMHPLSLGCAWTDFKITNKKAEQPILKEAQ